MYIVGLDLGKRKSQVCVGQQDGTGVVEKRIDTTREALTVFFAAYAPARILIEASTAAEWVARHLESLGSEVIVGDPRFGPMYAQLDKRIKTDKRDARGLMHANRLEAVHPAHRRSDETRAIRAKLLVRANFVRARARMVTQIRSLLESRGIPLVSCEIANFVKRLEGVQIDESLGDAILPLVAHVHELDGTLDALDAEMTVIAANHPIARRLDRVAGVGPITALAFVTAIDNPKRFENARQVASYFGFVPSERSSGEKQHRGATTKTGDTLTRGYLMQCAWCIFRSKRPAVAPLRAWALEVAKRRGKKIAVAGIARRLVRILFAMWRDDKDFDIAKLNKL